MVCELLQLEKRIQFGTVWNRLLRFGMGFDKSTLLGWAKRYENTKNYNKNFFQTSIVIRKGQKFNF